MPRIYTNKPRTTGDGYKGIAPPAGPQRRNPDMVKGLIAIRELHMRVLRETGFSCADEMLYPENYKYLDDVLAYVAVGARSVEDQQHRLTSSGISVPVGMKNPTGGDLSVMMNSITRRPSTAIPSSTAAGRLPPPATPTPTPSSGATPTSTATPGPTTTMRT